MMKQNVGVWSGGTGSTVRNRLLLQRPGTRWVLFLHAEPCCTAIQRNSDGAGWTQTSEGGKTLTQLDDCLVCS